MQDVEHYNSSDNSTKSSPISLNLAAGLLIVRPETILVVSVISVILICSLVGNVLVIVAVWQNRSLRTNTNNLLVNLCLADLLFSTMVLPCTIVSYLKSSFMFGSAFCVVYNYVQGVSVGLSAFTLTILSLERYYAICSPLTSRIWQTTNHCYKMIAVTWALALILMLPIAMTSELRTSPNGRWSKCVEDWSQWSVWKHLELSYTLFLDVVLFGIPLLIMTFAYMKIGIVLSKNVDDLRYLKGKDAAVQGILKATSKYEDCASKSRYLDTIGTDNNHRRLTRHESNQSNTHDKRPSRQSHLSNRGKVIRLVFVVVLEFFICWAPVYSLQTWSSVDAVSARKYVSPTLNIALRILAFASTCLHPITYCFMNASFRRGFLQICKCNKRFNSSFAADKATSVSNISRKTSRLQPGVGVTFAVAAIV